MRNTATGSGFCNSDVTPKCAFNVGAAPLGSDEPRVTLKFNRITVVVMKSLRAYMFLVCQSLVW